jgi:CRISPR/Cas system-associated exonuclease Cas4 (RecB family)
MSLKVSFSRLERYKQCSESYRLSVEERLSGIKINSPLFFGSAIDAAVELFLLKKKEELTEKELTLSLTEDAYSMFDKTMREQNGVLLEKNPLCDYFASDFDPAILKIEDLALLKKQYPSISDFFQFWESCNSNIQARRELNSSDRVLFNHMNWLSLYRKGELMLKAYETDILPQIHKVYAIQKDIQLKNAVGDELNGKIDFIASFTDNPELIFVCDNKTSSKAYTEDSVSNSPQLAIYCEAEGIPRASFVVMEKRIRVKDPKARVAIIKDDIYEDLKEIMFDKIDEVLHSIAAREFHKKSSPKECWLFGKPCEFYDLCWRNDDSKLRKR